MELKLFKELFNNKLIIMTEKMSKFQIEELEQRFEMSWFSFVIGAGPGPGTGTNVGTGQTGVPIGGGSTPTAPSAPSTSAGPKP